MISHWRRTLAMAPLLAAALLVSVSWSAWAANIVGVEIYSPTESYPVEWVRPGSTVTVMACVAVDGNAQVIVGALVGDGVGTSLTRYVKVPPGESVFSVPVKVPETGKIADGGNEVTVIAAIQVGNELIGSKKVSEQNAVYVDGTPPVVTLGALPTTPTTNPRPTWTWWGEDALSGLDYYIVTLDGELPFQTTGTSFTPSCNLADGEHVLRVKAVDKVGNVGSEKWSRVTIDTTPPAAPAIEPIARGYNTSPLTLKWNKVTDDKNAISYMLQWAKDAGFSGFHEVDIGVSEETQYVFSFTDTEHPENKGEGEYWFRVKTISTVNGTTTPPQTKESGWSAIVSTIYDVTGPAAPVLTLASKNPTNEPAQEWTWTRSVDAVNYDLYWSERDSAPNASTTPSAAGVANIDRYETSFNNPNEVKTYYMWVRGVDALGNNGLWSEKVDGVTPSVTVDMKAPVPPENLRLASDHVADTEGRLYTADGTPKVKWNAVADSAKYAVEIDGRAWIEILGPFGELTEISYEFTEGLADGEHTVRVQACDALGNWSGYSDDEALTFTVDATPPEAPGMPRTENPTANRRPRWTWDGTPGAVAYRVFLDGVAQPAGQPSGTPQPGTTFASAADLADGWHDLQVTAIDTLGNESAKSAAGSVLVDSTPPPVPDIGNLPTHTKATQVVFRWSSIGDVAGYNFSYIVDDGEEWTTAWGITTQSQVVKGPNNEDLDDGVTVRGMVQAYDSLGNTSEWSEIASTTIDLAGPSVSITAPAAQKNTNLSTFTWIWTGDDGQRGSGVQGYWVKLNDEAWSWTTEPVFTSSRLRHGANILCVKGVDNAGNEGAATAAHEVTLVDAVVFDIHPEPGARAINEVSTIAFSVTGLYDGIVEVLLGNRPLEDVWRLVTVVRTPELAKFYILLDADVMQPGMFIVTIRIGDVVKSCDYRVLSDRTGFGFGRLRPW